jgi:hypothetical protein
MPGCHGNNRKQARTMETLIVLTSGILVVETLHVMVSLYFHWKR